jgi:hypothetical protein
MTIVHLLAFYDESPTGHKLVEKQASIAIVFDVKESRSLMVSFNQPVVGDSVTQACCGPSPDLSLLRDDLRGQ